MDLKFIPPSEQELFDAYHYYEDQMRGLGNQFLNEFNRVIEFILKFPILWAKVGKRTRKALLKRFPYFILYIFEDEIVNITCIAHQHRDPDYYIDRIV